MWPHILGRGRTLSVAETLDGMLLLYCHSGCSVDEIICAAGFTINDLFPLVIPPASRGVGNGWYSIANAVDAIVDAARLLAAHAISNVSVDEICVAHLNLENKAQEFISIAHAALARGARK